MSENNNNRNRNNGSRAFSGNIPRRNAEFLHKLEKMEAEIQTLKALATQSIETRAQGHQGPTSHSSNAAAHHSKTVSSEIDHDATTNFVASEHVSLPNTTANVLSDLLDEDDMSSNSATKPASQQSIKAYVDAILGVTSSNKILYPCFVLQPANFDQANNIKYWNTGLEVKGIFEDFVTFVLPQPTVRGSLGLYVDAVEVICSGVASQDFITRTIVRGYTDTGVTAIDDDLTDRIADYTNTFTATDGSSYNHLAVTLQLDTQTNGAIDVNSVRLRCYYDT